MRILSLAFLAAIALTAPALVAPARADDLTVAQKNKKFDPDTITVKKGQKVTFSNQDPFSHNIYSDTPGMEFTIQVQPPGGKSEMVFDRVGEAQVKCAVHPSMKMSLKVVD